MNLGRKPKEITPEALEIAKNNPDKIDEIAKQSGVSTKTIHNRVKKQSLNLTFQADNGDATPPKIEELTASSQPPATPPPIDYEAMAKSFVSLLDMGCMMVGMVSKGRIEYERLSEKEKNQCANALKSETQALDFIAKSAPLNHVMAFGMVASVFATKFKVKKSDKKKELEKKSTNQPETSLETIVDNGEEETRTQTASSINKMQSMKNTDKFSSLAPNERPMFEDDFKEEKIISESPDGKIFLEVDPSLVDNSKDVIDIIEEDERVKSDNTVSNSEMRNFENESFKGGN